MLQIEMNSFFLQVYGDKTETAEKLRDLETGKLICGLPNPDSSQCLLPFNVPGVPGGCG